MRLEAGSAHVPARPPKLPDTANGGKSRLKCPYLSCKHLTFVRWVRSALPHPTAGQVLWVFLRKLMKYIKFKMYKFMKGTISPFLYVAV